MIERNKVLWTTFSIGIEEYCNPDLLTKVICAYEIDDSGSLWAGFSFCSPKDFIAGRYTRMKGRQLASDRLEVSKTAQSYITMSMSGLLSPVVQERDIYPLLKRIMLIEAKLMGIFWMCDVRMSDIY